MSNTEQQRLQYIENKDGSITINLTKEQSDELRNRANANFIGIDYFIYNQLMPFNELTNIELESWHNNSNEEEHELKNYILKLENEYFSDMTFKDDSIASDYFIKFSPPNRPKNKLNCGAFDLSKSYSLIRNFWININYNGDKQRYGSVSSSGKFKIHKNQLKSLMRKPLVLHEMIHAYEIMLEKYPFMVEVLISSLYNKLNKKIPNLYDELTTRLHFDYYMLIHRGGPHGVLFALKSFDLDLQCDYSIGTIYANYGYDEYKERYGYNNPNEPTESQRYERARKTAKLLGYSVQKSRNEDYTEQDQCGYRIIIDKTKEIIGGDYFDYSIEDIEFVIAELKKGNIES